MVDIIDVGNSVGARTARSVLEHWGIPVALHNVATASDLFKVLGKRSGISNYVVLMCHGVESNRPPSNLFTRIKGKKPAPQSVTPEMLKETLRLSDCCVVSTGYLWGNAEFAQAFLQAGCHTYIGATREPEADSALLYVLRFFYELQYRSRNVHEAHRRASAHNPETRTFNLYQRPA
jgi:hypothetical protein